MPSEKSQTVPVGAALVVGGGIGGMQAALDLANGGIKVYLAERGPAIGGVMAQLDKTFPTNDCAMCTMAPRLVEIGRHKDIDILTLSEVERVEGHPGNFTVSIKQQPRFIDATKCTGCGACTTDCPVTLPSDFDQGLGERKAIYRPFPQAVPNIFSISRRGNSPCEAACPIHQSAQGYVTLIAQGRFDEALNVILRDNPIPSICGRICAHPCTAACTRSNVDDPVNLPALKRFVTDHFSDYKLPQPAVPERPEKIAIVGSGPAGLLCAYQLRQKGYGTTIFEALPVAGGMLAVGIPSFRLPRPLLNAELDRLRAIGIEILLETPVGRAITFEELRKSYAAVFVAIGAHVERRLGILGEDLPGVTGGVEFLRQVNLGNPAAPGQRVLVVGGGNSALDAARAALRCGAADVTIVYRRTRAEMPADHREIEDAEREGIKLMFLAAPKAFHPDSGGRVAGLECVKMKLGRPDASGRPAPVPIPGSEFVIPCDAVVATIGQVPDVNGLGERLGLATTKSGTLRADPLTLETEIPGVFAGGDCVTGPDVVVTAMLAGKKAANSIDRWINTRDLRADRELEGPYHTAYTVDTAGVLMQRQIAVPSLDPATRGRSFDEVHTGYTPEQAIAEAKRCLACGICCDCHICATACQANAIDYTQTAQTRELNVGAIVLAPGFEIFDARLKKDLGYGRFPNVLTSLEFERILSASGPYSGHVCRPYDRQQPKRIAFLQCVGSRDSDRDYCSSVCCMYATKEAIIAKEHLGEGLQCDVFFMDMRAFSKGFEQYYHRAQELGVRYIRSRVPKIEEVAGTRDLVVHYLGENDKKLSQEYDLVVLSVGMQPPKDVKVLAERFGVALNKFNFCGTSTFRPAESSREGIFVAGPFAEPKDIPETVMQASAAASQVLSLLREARGTLITPRIYPPEREVKGEEPRIGVFVCHCGTNIAGVVNVPEVVQYAKTLPNVVYAENNLYTCSNDTQDRIKEKIAEHNLNRVVVASCTPRTHEPLFRNTMAEAGLNPYLFEMANIRDQCSWVHMREPEKATQKSKDLVRMALAKARLLQPLQRQTIRIEKSALVIGGGISGMTAALTLARQGFNAYLAEKENELGGNLRHIHYLLNGDRPQDELARLRDEIAQNRRVHLFTGAAIEKIEGTIGNFKTTITAQGTTTEIPHGVVIVATGAKQYQPKEYLHGEDDRVITQRELEARLAAGNGFLKDGNHAAKTVVMIQCVGSRDADHPYCSRVCCADAIKNALRIKAVSPDTNVYVLYRDIRTYGFKESYYTKARQQGVVFVRYDEERKPDVSQNAGRLKVTVYDQTLGMPIAISADWVVLSAGIHPHEDNRKIAQFLKVPLNSEGFFLEAHMKLRPVDFMTDGVFLCGLAHSPKSIDECILQAQAASARAASVLVQDSLELGANISQVVDESCDGCAYCVDTCPYQAITLLEYKWQGSIKKVVETNDSICKGCGCCQATCPKNGVFIRGFTLGQIEAQIHAALGVE
ncbi:MAG TPA: FAD-dependent oxidoreductase [Candidatus Sulfotelmatobacter sp.]|nr:FAD-dependent oxidoreductase [Candidatus Sulfotelmatobacter sp.]